MGVKLGTTIRDIKGDTRSLDYGSFCIGILKLTSTRYWTVFRPLYCPSSMPKP